MKKSIFLFFAAILCAMSVSAKMVYLKPSGNWKEAGAIFYVWYWTGTGAGTAGKMQQVELGLYGYDIGNNTSFLITRNKSTAGDPWTDKWAQTGDLTYNADKPCYYVKNWNENGSGLIALPSAHIAGATELTGHNWSASASDNKMTKQNDGTWTLTKTIASINQGDYGYKVTDGSWDWSLGKNSNDNATINIPATGKYEVTFTYNPSNETVSAVATPIYSVTVNSGEGGTASGISECVSGNSVNISAEALENYEFVNWTIASGTGSFGNASEASTTFQPTSNATIQANFRSTVTYSLTLQGGTGIASVTGNNDNVTLDQSYNISAEIVDGYSFAGWTADVAANAEITDASLASTSVVVKNGSVVLTASATENKYTLTTSNTYSEGTPDIAVPTTSTNEIGVVTTATITAAAKVGYKLSSWTLKNCVRTDGGAENATEITVKSDANGNATIVANYTKVPTETVYFINTNSWATINAYVWSATTNNVWPGQAMTATGVTIASFDVYSFETDIEDLTNIIFNCGGDECKTGDLTWQAGKYYAPSTGEWYADAAAAEAALATPIPDETVYLINTGNWSKAMIHTWNGVGGTAWPGVEMTLTGETIEGYAVYSYTAKQGGQANLLFQESADVNKTGDLEWQAGKYYAPLKNEWYDTKEAAAEALAAPIEYEYVYLINTNDWTKAHIYTWTPEVAGWPGAAMTKEAEQIAGKDVYSYKVVKGTTFGGLNFNCGGDECKTGDLEWQAGKYYAPSKNTWYDDVAAAEDGLTATPAPAKCYLMGIGGDWTTGIEMEEDGDQFKLLCQPIAEGEQFKFKYGDTWTTEVENYDANGVNWVESSPGSGQYNITLPAGNYDFYYKKNDNKVWIGVCTPVTPTPDYTRAVTPGNLGTICLPSNVPAGKASGATFYTLAGMDANDRVAFYEVTGELEAGKSYLFQANAAEIVCYYGTTSVLTPDENGAMKGTFVDMELDELSSIYYFAKNALWSCEDLTELIVPANCAYVDMGKVTAIKEAAPVGVRRITLGVNGQNTVTGVDQVQGDEVPTKMIINGQLFILRGEKMYDAQGKLVK